ncbi:methyltransferase [Nitrosopumilus sp. b3]|uniref:class I SAM-dependent methyltransferase n=1 Tax=Nitrosopumilus sp. b3 TaxID=2109909 RepID=UPI0015F41E8A|nr:class I SAM-dependent methyltransferase [Nitrosopumilus sp. b3]KAF6247129.1 methyltransferase [Nitrosopumilus sp. b3]
MGFFDTEKGVNEYIKMAEGFDGTELIKILQKFLPLKSTVLELGMGPGKDLDILNESYLVTGSDYSQIFIDKYRRQKPDADLLKLDAITIPTDRTFDCIYSNKVLHHLTREDLKKSFQRQKKVLNPNGIGFHSFWRGDEDENYDGLLFTKYQIEELKKVAENDFEILAIEIYTEMEKDDSIYLMVKNK